MIAESCLRVIPSLYGETLAALGAACIDHCAATFGFHARAEPVGTLAANY